MDFNDLRLHDSVLVDGIPGYIEHIYPEGKSPYIGRMHAYVWVRTPSLDYTEWNFDRSTCTKRETGRAVGLNTMNRIKRV